MKSEKIDSYLGKIINVGIDVHKKTYKVCVVVDGVVVKKWSAAAKPNEFIFSLNKFFPGAEKIRSVYEAGFSGFVLHRKAIESGIESIVVNPSSIEVAANERVKTDKRDAAKLAALLSLGRLKGIHVPTVAEELSRLLPRTREQLVEQRIAVGNQIKSKLYQFGFIDPDNERIMSPLFLDWVASLDLAAELRIVLQELSDEWRNLASRIRRLEKELEAQAQKEPERETILRSVPGIGPVSSRILSTELGDVSRFSSEKDLFSFTGLTPCEYSSGDNVRRGHISRQGPGRIRDILVEISWRAIKDDSELNCLYERIKVRRGAKIAIVAVARHLVGRIRACLRRGKVYETRQLLLLPAMN